MGERICLTGRSPLASAGGTCGPCDRVDCVCNGGGGGIVVRLAFKGIKPSIVGWTSVCPVAASCCSSGWKLLLVCCTCHCAMFGMGRS